jgi:hypothetical protein
VLAIHTVTRELGDDGIIHAAIGFFVVDVRGQGAVQSKPFESIFPMTRGDETPVIESYVMCGQPAEFPARSDEVLNADGRTLRDALLQSRESSLCLDAQRTVQN